MLQNNKKISILSVQDWREYKDIRLSLLKEYPRAFSTELDEEIMLSDAQWQEKLNPQHALFVGIKVNNKLIALAGAQLYAAKRLRHKAYLISIGARNECPDAVETLQFLLQEFLLILKNRGIVQVTTTLNENAPTAQAVYAALGFKLIGTLEKEIFDNGEYINRLLYLKILQ